MEELISVRLFSNCPTFCLVTASSSSNMVVPFSTWSPSLTFIDLTMPLVKLETDCTRSSGTISPVPTTTTSILDKEAQSKTMSNRRLIKIIIHFPAICAGRSTISNNDGIKSYFSVLSFCCLYFRK